MFARLGFTLLLSGCATSWIALQASGTQRALDEGVHEVRVPQPGVDEHLTVSLPLATQVTGAGSAAQPAPFALTCTTEQQAHDVVYHQAFRYGSRWKKMTAFAFVLEGALGAALLLTADSQHPDGYLYGGFFALDAAITAPLFFIPRKEIYRTDNALVTTPVRSDCPDGLALEIAGDTFPIDAAGKISDVGEAALAAWMKAPSGAIRVTVAGQARDLYIDEGGRCTWLRDHGGTPCSSYSPATTASVVIGVPAGTFALN